MTTGSVEPDCPAIAATCERKLFIFGRTILQWSPVIFG